MAGAGICLVTRIYMSRHPAAITLGFAAEAKARTSLLAYMSQRKKLWKITQMENQGTGEMICVSFPKIRTIPSIPPFQCKPALISSRSAWEGTMRPSSNAFAFSSSTAMVSSGKGRSPSRIHRDAQLPQENREIRVLSGRILSLHPTETNNSTKSRSETLQKLQNMGVQSTLDEVIT